MADERFPFGRPGEPLRRSSPFYIGFVGALGVLMAWGLMQAIASVRQVLVLVVVAMFLAVGLNPLVERLMRWRVKRPYAVGLVALGVLAIFGGFIAAIIPPLITQTTELVSSIPGQLARLQQNQRVQRLDEEYHFIEGLRNALASRNLAEQVFGGVLGVGRFVFGSVFSTITVLILTLYFLGSFPHIKQYAYRLAPQSRRERVRLLGDEILAGVGGYVNGILLVASIAGLSTFIFVTIIGLDYAVALAITVALSALIPLVGATLGAVIVTVVALFDSPGKALACLIFFVIYQQIENYLISPRIMKRSINVPPGVTIVAALAGGTMLGFTGALIAIPTAAALLLIIREVVIPRQEAA